jgi:hypothetical protein
VLDPILRLTRQTVHVRTIKDKNETSHLVYEGEVKMSEQAMDAYKALVGDALGRVTVSKELSESSYGNGGKAMVSISLTCDQSHPCLNAAITLADNLATHWVGAHHDNMRQLVSEKGIRG